MSRRNVATYPVAPLRRRRFKRRRLEERLLLQFPRLASVVRSVAFHLPVGSRLRREIFRTACRHGFDALRRGEYEAMAAVCHPEVETTYLTAPGETVRDLETEYKDREGLIQSLRSWSEASSSWASSQGRWWISATGSLLEVDSLDVESSAASEPSSPERSCSLCVAAGSPRSASTWERIYLWKPLSSLNSTPISKVTRRAAAFRPRWPEAPDPSCTPRMHGGTRSGKTPPRAHADQGGS